MNQTIVLHSKFDVEIHKKTFVDYLEVIILEDGTVEYAVPSHQEKLISIMMKKFNITRAEVENCCPPEYYFNLTEWLCKETNCIAVWTYFIKGECNENQMNTLKKLRQENIFYGDL